MIAPKDWSELRILRAELLDAHRDLIRARNQAEQLIISNRDLSSLLASASTQAGELLKMSVAFKQLSGAEDAAAALWAVEDVAINIIGTEDFVLLACDTARMRAIAGMGDAFDEALNRPPTLAQLRQSEDRVVPLAFGGNLVGALVIRRLLDHRAPLTPADEQVLALLCHFAGAAIVAWVENRDRSIDGRSPKPMPRPRAVAPDPRFASHRSA